jgi:ubiquinone/menaquinone biosynthesis C-methylase UbiE
MAETDTQFIKPELILQQIGLQPGMQVADLGCGLGYFALPAAKITGLRGKVYAVDVQKSVLEQVKKEAQLQNIVGIETVWSDIETVGAAKILPRSLDMVFVINTLFQASHKEAVFSEARRLLKPSGFLLVVDWLPGDTAMGPPVASRLDLGKIKAMANAAGFVFQKDIAAGSHHFGLLFQI